MRRSCVLALLVACGGDAPADRSDGGGKADDPAEPSRDLARDVQAYDLALDLAARTGTARITFAPSASSGATLEIGSLTITSVSDANGPLEFETEGELLDIGVPSGDAPVQIAVDYEFAAHDDFDGWMQGSGLTFLWPYFCQNLFPCHSAPADGARFELEVTGGPADAAVVYPRSIPGDAPSYMPAIAVGDYTKVELGTTSAGTDVAVWHLPGEDSAAATGTANLVAVFDWLEQNVGDYTFGDEVGTVSAPWGPGAYGGMEHHPYWHVASGALSSEEVNAHEAAHGWYGNGVRIACWEDFVLSEGVVTYLAARALAGSGVDLWPDYECDLEAVCAGAQNTVVLPDATCNEIDLLSHPLWSSAPYMKGAFFLREVADALGEDAVDQALAEFYRDHVGEPARMRELVDHLAAAGDPSTVEALAEAWLEGEACPVDPAELCN